MTKQKCPTCHRPMKAKRLRRAAKSAAAGPAVVTKSAGQATHDTFIAKMHSPDTVSREEQQAAWYAANPGIEPPAAWSS